MQALGSTQNPTVKLHASFIHAFLYFRTVLLPGWALPAQWALAGEGWKQ